MVILIRDLIMYSSFTTFYSYPEEDICYFKDFPHKHLVIPYLYTMRKINCTCTLKWIHFYNENYEKISPRLKKDYYDYVSQNLHIKLISTLKLCGNDFKRLNCDFERKLNNCKIE